LIGADQYWRIVGRKVHINETGMAATESRLGWLLSGSVQQTLVGRSSKSTNLLIKAYHRPVIEPILPEQVEYTESNNLKSAIDDLSAFFELEHIGIRDQEVEGVNQKLSERIDPEIVQLSSGRFQVPLPWNGNKSSLSSNRRLAENRLRSLLHKLSQDPALLVEYDQQIQKFVKLGFLSEVTPSENDVEYYPPHLAVIRPDKISHRLRIVFDASAKSKGGLSLNDCVEVGDNLYPDMLAILLRFCWSPIAWIGDITKAFLQMELKPEDRSACRILWIKDVNNAPQSNLVVYQWNRVTFGIASSPFLLTATIRKLLRKFKDKYPETTASICKNTFADDWAGGASTPESAFTSIKEASIVFNDSLGVEEEHNYRLEIKKKALVNIVEVCQRIGLLRWERFSSLNFLLKTVAWMRRPFRRQVMQDADTQPSDVVSVIETINGPVPVTMLDGAEIHDAEIVSIRCVQRELFSKEFEALEKSSPLPRDSKLLDLRPVFDKELRIIRVTGRVSQSFQHLNIKPPILLPSDHHFVVLLVSHIHLKIHHSGFKATYAEIKKRFWIVKGRSVVKKIMGKCVICSKLHSRSFQEEAADLPLDRARLAQPFEVVGVDYAGHCLLKLERYRVSSSPWTRR